MKTINKILILVAAVALLSLGSCGKSDDEPTPKNSIKQITSFVFLLTKNPLPINIVATIDEETKSITAMMPPNTDITGLLPDIEIHEAAQVNPNTAQNFTDPVEYTVTAEDGRKVVYTVNVTVALGQRQILQAIQDANPGNTLGWDLANATDLGSLDGVSTNVEGNIIVLDLAIKKLSHFSPEIGQLTSLTSLSLQNNQLTFIPPEIGQLMNLTNLNLGSNQLTSIPPEIGQLISLEVFSLYNNQLTSFPLELWQMTSLTVLYLGSNQLTSISPEIGQLTSLTGLYLGNNQLTSIPPEIGRLTSLIEFRLHNNQLISIPPEIGQLTDLVILGLFTNQITSLPLELGKLARLNELYVSNNQLTSIPPEMGNWTSLIYLSLSNNQLTSIPLELGKLTNLIELSLSNNQLTSIPSEIGFMTNLSLLNISGNNLTTIPQAICNLKQFNEPSMIFAVGASVTCEITSSKNALIGIYSANPGNTLGWGVNNYPGVSFDGNRSVTAIDIKGKGISRITSPVATLEFLELLDLRNNPLGSIDLEVCALTLTSDFTILTDPGEGCE